jgi:hypothetical protein
MVKKEQQVKITPALEFLLQGIPTVVLAAELKRRAQARIQEFSLPSTKN